jgi:hypothetical protein
VVTPPERCPYLKPFPDDFDECPAYQPVQYVAFDLNHRPLPAVWTCGHLEAARGPYGGYFPRCRLGDRAAREAWVARIAADRVARWQAMAREFGEAIAEPLAAMYGAKAHQLKVMTTGGEELAAAERALREEVERFLELNFSMLDERAEELHEIGFPTEPMKVVTRAAMEDLVRRGTVVGGWTPPETLMEPFPDETREFLRGLFTGSTAGDGRP